MSSPALLFAYRVGWAAMGWASLILATPLLLTMSPQLARAQAPTPSRILRGVSVAEGNAWTVIEIQLDVDARVLSHAPADHARTLEIQVRPEPGFPLPDELHREVLEWRNRDVVGLIDVEFDGGGRSLWRLLVHFDREMTFEIAQSDDLDRVRIAVMPYEPPSEELSRPARDTPSTEADDKIEEILAEGRKAMTAGEYGRAVLLFTKVLGHPEHPSAPAAKELLGLAHQRKGQLAHARAEFEDYLARYPDAEGAPRVRQRLQALLTVKRGQQPAARKRAPSAPTFSHSYAGSLSQFYRHTQLESDELDSFTASSSLDSSFFLSSRHAKRGLSVRSNFSGSYRYDRLGEGSASDALRITSAFVDTKVGEGAWSLRFGRQSSGGGGVLGRFDGINGSVELPNRWRLGLVSGFPVDFTESNRINDERPFYGINADTGTFAEYWEAQFFAIQQFINGLEDRTAVGGQLRFSHPDGFALALVDYDTSYSELNTAMLIGNWRASEATSFNVLVDVRKSPILTTFNAIQGQLVTDLDDLQELATEDQIRELADARTATSRIFTLGATHRLDETWQVSGDVTVSNLGDTEATTILEPVAATEGTGNEYFFALRSTATNLLIEGSFTSFDLRFANTATNRRYSFGVSGRYPIIEHLRIGPAMLVELRDNDDLDDQWRYRPSIRVDYRWRSCLFQLDVGAALSEGSANTGGGDQREYFLNVGYRYDF